MNNPVFSIRNLRCAYQQGRTVLSIPNLDIPAGCLVFLIGPSGVGKSTLIETLGLMNRTVVQDGVGQIDFQPRQGDALELAKIWSDKKALIAQVRNRHFSFIFQNTNLMANFSSGENMAMSLLVKGKTFEEAKKEVLKVMEMISLPKEIFDKRVSEVSGGQRQRLAFVRAITADFDVLFGDEPTGNLDAGTAEDLMEIVRTSIKTGGKTGIIVSHDLPLALQFADVIIPISSQMDQAGEVFGVIDNRNILRKQGSNWVDAQEVALSNPLEKLSQHVFKSTNFS